MVKICFFWVDLWIGDVFLKVKFRCFFVIILNKEVLVASMGVWDGVNWSWVFQWRRKLFVWEVGLKNDLVVLFSGVFLDYENGNFFFRLMCKKLMEFGFVEFF